MQSNIAGFTVSSSFHYVWMPSEERNERIIIAKLLTNERSDQFNEYVVAFGRRHRRSDEGRERSEEKIEGM